MDSLKVTSSPHIKHEGGTRQIMLDVLIALAPAVLWGVYIFGLRVLVLVVISMVSAAVFEYIYRKLMKKDNTVTDLSALVTGLLLALTLPVSAPLWMPVVGSCFAIVLVKQLFGGIGKNVVNPALAARVFLFAAFPQEMTLFTQPSAYLPAFQIEADALAVDAAAGATPLALLKTGTMPDETFFDLFVGNRAGAIGEISVLLLLIGGIYLLARRVITLHIPLAFLGTTAIVALIFPVGMSSMEFMVYTLITGGLVLGAFFMATDYTTSPVTPLGRIIYGVGCGLITMLIRYFGGYPEGVSFAILMMNLLVWYLDRLTKPVRFGGKPAKAVQSGGKHREK